MNHNQIIYSGLLIASLALAGCKEQKQPASTQPNPRSPTMTDVNQPPRTANLAAESTAAAKVLPGSNDSKDRRLSEPAFERATAVLTLLAGPRPNGGFRQDQRIIEMIRQQLRTAPAGMAMDPAVDTGLCGSTIRWSTSARAGFLSIAASELSSTCSATASPIWIPSAARSIRSPPPTASSPPPC